ncbi:MAG TPA: efflux RND transporter permease subunit, partial [Longimicrobium sp.]|nr:efflux RND transporter permease subunit [Longimicrobium sp.]
MIRLGDVADARDGTEEARSAAVFNGEEAVGIDVKKAKGFSTTQVASLVRGQVEQIQAGLPEGVAFRVVRDAGTRVAASVQNVQEALIEGAALTVLVVFLFLNSWRSTVITGLALPVSVLASFVAVLAFGFTLNTMSLLGLSLAIGILIDDAIVVRENIVRHVEMGKDHHRAAREGTSEIGLAVLSTTLAVIAVFIPVAFMGGQIGLIFFQFGVVVAFAVMVSLFVSFTLDPMLSSVWPDPEVENHGPGRKRGNIIQRTARGFNDWFERVADRYPRWLAWALDHRKTVVGFAATCIIASMLIIPRLGFTWVPDFDGGEFNVNFRVAPGSRLEYTVDRGHEVAAMLRKMPEVDFTYMSIGGGFRGSPNNGRIFVKLKPKEERERSQQEMQDGLRRQLAGIAGVRANITGTPTIFGGFRQPIQVNVQGPEQERLKLAAEQVMQVLQSVPGVAEPTSSQEGEIPQLDVDVDREQAWAAGVGIASIAQTLQPLFTGQRATQWEDEQGYSHDVVVIYPDSVRTSAGDVAGIVVPSSSVDPGTGRAAMIPLSQVATVRGGMGPQTIERSSLERQISISAGVMPGYAMGDVANDAREALDAANLPAGYRTVFRGDVQNLEETKGYVLAALGMAVVFIYIILASLFGSFLQPLAIMLALPLSFIGVGLALLLTGGNLNVFTMIGIIMLM